MSLDLPDVPRWVETRWLLRTAGAQVLSGEGGSVVIAPSESLGAIVGAPGGELIRRAVAMAPDDLELVVQPEDVESARAVLADWAFVPATIHTLLEPFDPAAPEAVTGAGVVVSEPPDPALLGLLPADLREDAAGARAMAVSLVDGEVAAVCAAGSFTETLWDVGIDTVPAHRRRGHAVAVYRALAAHLATAGLQPIWGAEDDNQASLGLAAKLGFRPVDRLFVARRRS